MINTIMNFKHWLLLTEAKKASDIAKELVGDDFEKIKSIIPINAQEKLQSQLLSIAAFYHKQQPRLDVLKQYLQDYAHLVKLHKMPTIIVKDDLTIDGNFKSYIYWTEIIDGKKYEDKVLNMPIQGDLENQEIIAHSTNNKIKVYLANSKNQCVILGKGETFCISQPVNSMFQSYRDTKISTFYFVHDNTRTDDLAIVVVDVTRDGIELTDRKNKTAETMQDPYSIALKRINSNPDLYFKYLKENGIDTNAFVNIPKSPEEKLEEKKLGQINYDLQWFKSLSSEEKSKYIGRGHWLTNLQFDYIYDNNFTSLLKQYVKNGSKVYDHQLKKIADKKELKDIYLHNRLIANKISNDLYKEEFDLLNPKQKEEFYNVGNEEKLAKALQVEDIPLIKELIEKGQKVPYYAISVAIKNNNLDLVKHFVKHGLYLSDFDAVDSAIIFNNLNILKYLVDEKNQEIKPRHIEKSFGCEDANIAKYFIDEKNKKIPWNAVNISSQNYYGSLDVLKYLIEEKKQNITVESIRTASLAGNFYILKYLMNKKDFILSPREFTFVINNAKTQAVKDYLIKYQKQQMETSIATT